MKAASKFLSAASAVALSAALVVPGAVAVQFVATSAAEAAVVSRVEVTGNQRVDADTIRNYITIKNKTNDRERIEMKKYCRFDRRHTLHKETR